MTIIEILDRWTKPDPPGFTLKQMADSMRKSGIHHVSPYIPLQVTPIQTTPPIKLSDIKNRCFNLKGT